MGLAFFAFGVMGLFNLMKAPDNLPENIKTVDAALTMAGYMKVASATMALVGLLLLINRFVPLALALNDKGKLGFDTYDLDTSETEGSIKVGLGVGGGGGGSASSESQSDRSGLVRMPGGGFEPRICKQPS